MNTKIEFYDSALSQIFKRLQFDENEVHRFGEYVMKYMPLMLQNAVSENLNSCLPYDVLKSYKLFLDTKYVTIKEQMHQKPHPLRELHDWGKAVYK